MELEPRAPSQRAPPVARLVGDDRQQPGAERRTLAEAAARAVRLDEGVLHDLLGVGGRARDDVCGAEGDHLVLADELLVVVEMTWSAHHCPFYTRGENPVPRRRLASIPCPPPVRTS